MPGPTARLAISALCAAALTAWATSHAWQVFGATQVGIDDANISMVYGRNLAQGYGFVFTPGYERVEGFTSLAWVLLISVCYLATDSPETAMLALSWLFCTFSVACVLWWCMRIASYTNQRGAWAVSTALAVAWLVRLPAFYVWNTVTLMDLALWTALISAMCVLLVADIAAARSDGRYIRLLSATAAALVLTRPEAMVVVPGLLLLGAGLQGLNDGRWSAALRRFAPSLGAFVATAAVLTAFRLVYFGYPLPNTYYAKVPPSWLTAADAGARYVGGFLQASPVAAVLLGLAGVVVIAAVRRRPGPDLQAALVAAAVVLGGMTLPLAGGGDHFGSWRFLQPFVPTLVVPLVFFFNACLRNPKARTRIVTAAGVALAAVLAIGAPGTWTDFASGSGMRREFDLARNGRKLGEVLSRAYAGQTLPRVGQIMTGGFGLTYQGRTLDLVGLNWTQMGHSKGTREGYRNHSAFNADVFWEHPPDIVAPNLPRGVPRTSFGVLDTWSRGIVNHIDAHERFRTAYDPGLLHTKEAFVAGFFAKDWTSAHPHPGFRRLPWR